MTAAWWRKSRGSRAGGDGDPPFDPAKLLAAPAGLLQSVIEDFVRVYRLSADESGELAAKVRARLAENDFEVLRSFQGLSSLRTFLAVAVERVGAEFQEELWDRWRAEAASTGRGEWAATLERLVYEEALSFEEALEVSGAGSEAAERTELEALWAKRPSGGGRPVTDLKWQRLAGKPPPSREPTDLERQLSAALHQLDAEERLILYQRFARRSSVEAIALWQHRSPGELSRKIDALLARLREELARAGVEAPDLEALLSDPRPGYSRKRTET